MLAYPSLASSYHSKINLMTSRIQFNTQNSLVAQANHMLVNLMAPYNVTWVYCIIYIPVHFLRTNQIFLRESVSGETI